MDPDAGRNPNTRGTHPHPGGNPDAGSANARSDSHAGSANANTGSDSHARGANANARGDSDAGGTDAATGIDREGGHRNQEGAKGQGTDSKRLHGCGLKLRWLGRKRWVNHATAPHRAAGGHLRVAKSAMSWRRWGRMPSPADQPSSWDS
jgi:hypothetical protein